MSDQRAKAKAAGLTTYEGAPCRWDHGGERYVTNGACVQCVKDTSTNGREAKRKKTMSEPAIAALLKRGGPRSRTIAEAAGLDWYNNPNGFSGVPKGMGPDARCSETLSIHGIIGLDGYCPLCGGETPDVMTVEDMLA